jgi:IS5 family transposase
LTLRVNQSLAKTTAIVNCRSARPPRLIQIDAPFSSRLSRDSQKLDDVLDKSNTGAEVWADSAYRSAEIEAKLEAQGYKSRVHRRARRNQPLSRREQAGNTTRSRVRARVEHVFGHQHTSMGGTIVRTIGIVRARAKIGLMNLVYNISRLVQLERVAAAPV